jgi:hypothetical protein
MQVGWQHSAGQSNITSLLRYAHFCVGVSVGNVAPIFGKHVHPTGHLAPIHVLFGLGIPELVSGTSLGVSLALKSIMTMAAINKIREIIKNAIRPPSI